MQCVDIQEMDAHCTSAAALAAQARTEDVRVRAVQEGSHNTTCCSKQGEYRQGNVPEKGQRLEATLLRAVPLKHKPWWLSG